MQNYLMALILCVSSVLGYSQRPYIVSDLTAENVFTPSCEGPAVDQDLNLYAVNFGKNGTICIVKPGKAPELFVTLPEGSTGNGIRFNKEGVMFVADYTGHNVLQINRKTREIKVFAHEDNFNQPNDLAISNSGILFLSDPKWIDNTGKLWKVMPDGNIVLLNGHMGTTNGIEVSPDDRHLYVNESIQRCLWVFDLDTLGNISNKRLLYQFPDFGLDGMRCDSQGNLYVARHGKGCIAIIDPEGNLLQEVPTKGKKTSNVTFGGKDGKTVYVTLQDRGCIEWFRSSVKGAR